MKHFLISGFLLISLEYGAFAQVHEAIYGDTLIMHESYNSTIKDFEYEMNIELDNGKWIIYWDSSKKIKAIEAEYKNQKKSGVWIYYSKNGNKKSVISWENGKLSGRHESYYENGKLSQSGSMKAIEGYCKGSCSEPSGTWKYYSEQGNLIEEKIWNEGKLVEDRKYDENGKLKENN